MSREEHDRLSTADLLADTEHHREMRADEARRPAAQDDALRPDPRRLDGTHPQGMPQQQPGHDVRAGETMRAAAQQIRSGR